MYDGSASKFHEWSFRASMRWASAKDDDKPKMMNIVIEGLRGEAALVAMDLGKDVLIKADGMDDLINAMRANVFPKAQAEAKDLYRAGHKIKGPLSGQPNEPMVS